MTFVCNRINDIIHVNYILYTLTLSHTFMISAYSKTTILLCWTTNQEFDYEINIIVVCLFSVSHLDSAVQQMRRIDSARPAKCNNYKHYLEFIRFTGVLRNFCRYKFELYTCHHTSFLIYHNIIMTAVCPMSMAYILISVCS